MDEKLSRSANTNHREASKSTQSKSTTRKGLGLIGRSVGAKTLLFVDKVRIIHSMRHALTGQLTMAALLIYGQSLSALPCRATAQGPTVGIIDLYGARTVSEARVRQALGINEGDPVPGGRKEAQRRLEALPRVVEARLNFVCCEDGKYLLFVGIREKGHAGIQFRPAPTGTIRLPPDVVETGESFDNALTEAVRKGNAGEDDSRGHALSTDSSVRGIQDRFITIAARDQSLLRDVLRNSSDEGHRALAAFILPYSKNKRAVVPDLMWAIRDSSEAVRNNSIRGLGVMASFARRSPAEQIRIPTEVFVPLLNSIEWSDRNKASFVLFELTQDRNPAILSSLRAKALPSLIEMARWRSKGHAFQPFFLLGRAGGIKEEEIQAAWDRGDRESLIRKVKDSLKSQ